MVPFESDYNNGVQPEIPHHLFDTNDEQTSGYGNDPYCEQAKEKIRHACQMGNAEIYFLIGGTQTNTTMIDALLAPGEGVIATNMAHINVHEAGAVEAFGHKVLAKGRMLGLQFDTFFTDDLYGRISRHTIDMAMRMKALFRKYGIKLAIDSPTNQQFVILTPEQQQRLAQSIVFEVWEQKDDKQLICRFVTSRATTDNDLTALEKALANG